MKLRYLGESTLINDLFQANTGDVVEVPRGYNFDAKQFERIDGPKIPVGPEVKKESEVIKSGDVRVAIQPEVVAEEVEEIVEPEPEVKKVDEEAIKFKYWIAKKPKLKLFLSRRDIIFGGDESRKSLIAKVKLYLNSLDKE